MKHKLSISALCLSAAGAILFVGCSDDSSPSGTTDQKQQEAAKASDITAVSYGDQHGCFIQKGALKCWGKNDYGQIGNNAKGEDVISRDQAVTIFPDGVTAVSAGGDSTCAIRNGGLLCFGHNNHGKLGNNSTEDSPAPSSAIGLDHGVTAVSVGYDHTCAIQGGALKCWGWNNSGRLGVNFIDSVSGQYLTPVPVFGMDSNVSAVSVRDSHSCAIRNGALFCWGDNFSGQLGRPMASAEYSDIPIPVLALAQGVTAVSVGHSHTCAIQNDGVKCFGFNGDGILGNNSTTDTDVPTPADGLDKNVSAIGSGSWHSCAVQSGALKCWGYNGSNRLGFDYKTVSKILVPTLFPGLDRDVTAIGLGGIATCAIQKGLTIKCSGE